MFEFKDTKGRAWRIEPTVGAARRVQLLTGINLLDLKANPFLRFAQDIMALVDCLFALVKPQADALAVTDVEFGESMDGETLQAALVALEGAYALFFHRQEDRTNVALVLQRTNQALAVAGEVTRERIDSIDLPSLIRAEAEKSTHGPSSGAAPASAA